MITVVGEDKSAHRGIVAVSPAQQLAPATWKVGDEQVAGDGIATGSLSIGPGFVGQLDLTLVSPAGSTGSSSVKLFRRYLDRVGNELDEFVSAAIAVDAVEATHTLTLPSAPESTAVVEWGLRSNMAPVGAPVRINEYADPRCTNATYWKARNAWELSTRNDGANIGGVAGLSTYVAAAVLGGTGGTGTLRGLDWYQAIDAGAPAAGVGQPVTAGTTITVSAWVRNSTRALTLGAAIRFFGGTAWVGAAVYGGTVAAAINTWVRVSVTAVVPAGATHVVGFFGVPGSVSWSVIGEHNDCSGVLVEVAGAVATYFDGTTKNGIAAPSSVRWEGGENSSRSLLYTSATPGGTTIAATASKLTYSADADELIGATLERDLRRSVADVWSRPGALITAGSPGLLAGTLTYLCSSLAQALGVEAVYRMGGLVTLNSDDELDGLTHRAVERSRFAPQVLAGRAARWTLTVDVREQA